MDRKLKYEIDELLYLTLENAASPEQVKRLDDLIESNPEIQKYAVDYYFITAALRKTNTIPSASFDTQHEIAEQYNLLMDLAREEKNAPVLEVPEDQKDTNIVNIQKVQVNKTAPRINKLSLLVAITSLAALLILIAYVSFIPPTESVAVLQDSINAEWQNVSEKIESGYQFYNKDDPILLKSGIIELEFDYGAKVVIEGPSEFSCKSANLIYLNYGRLYARVPELATGFTVDTKNARIVDLGTEFGVQANVDRTTEFHVLKGSTKLLAGKDKEKKAFDIFEGHARQVNAEGESVKEVSLKKDAFVQQFDSKTGLIRKGQKVINLADIVGGGTGLGTGRIDYGVDPGTGRFVSFVPERLDHPFASNAYRSFKAHPFIDGVFVPSSSDGIQIISSYEHIFPDCPETNGSYYARIINGTNKTFGGGGPGLVLDGTSYGSKKIPSIFMHTNQGITFDISAIRQALHGTRLVRFESVCGISQTAATSYGLAHIYVLVDGELRFSQRNIRRGQSYTINIELNDRDHFLTLITATSSKKVVPEGIRPEHGDWCLFGRPYLVLD